MGIIILHVEPIHGFYHGQDPRTFSLDAECCSEKERMAHRAACEAADRGEWNGDDSSCRYAQGIFVLKSSFGLGVYRVVMDQDGDFVRDATYEDYCREGEWEEEPPTA